MDIFSLAKDLFFIKWKNFEIGVQELFWPTIVEILSHVKTDCNNKEVIVPLAQFIAKVTAVTTGKPIFRPDLSIFKPSKEGGK